MLSTAHALRPSFFVSDNNYCFLHVFCRMIMSVPGMKIKVLMTVSVPPFSHFLTELLGKSLNAI